MKPPEVLRTYIDRYASKPVTDEEFAVIEKAFVYKKLRRRELFLHAGEVCKYYAFVVTGALRQYCVDEKGTDQVINFAVENWWIGDRESYFMSTTSNYYIDAMEDCELMLITRDSLQTLKSKVPAITEMLLELDNRSAIANQMRLLISIRATAVERYLKFTEQYPDFADRFPLHMIASFLGISAETLSRVRLKVLRKAD